jgi:serine/threonine protein kinase
MQYVRWKIAGKTVGGGGQGQVELVTDASGKESGKFALKKLKDDRRIERFKQEIDAVTKLNHPNIIRVVDRCVGPVVDRCVGKTPRYYVMEYCEGGSLEKIGGQTFKGDIVKATEILDPICDALGAAHKAGIVHRDVKPANILMREDGTPVIADFGICHVDENESITLHEEAMGPINYIAPEMESGRRHLGDPSEKTDVYALGKVLYWMLSGGSIFGREDHRATPLTAVLSDQRWEHVHMLLDKVIVEKPSDRLGLDDFRQELQKVRDLVMGNYAPLKPSIGIKCRFCGLGTYARVGQAQVGYTGGPVQAIDSKTNTRYIDAMNVLACDDCGHVEFFDAQRTNRWWTQ